MEFLKANGISDPHLMKEMDYQDVLGQQEIFEEELFLFSNKDMQKEVSIEDFHKESGLWRIRCEKLNTFFAYYRLPPAGSLFCHLYLVQIKTWCYHHGEERISIMKSWRQKENPVNGNKQNCHITRLSFDIWKPSNTALVRYGGRCPFWIAFL